MSEPPVVVDLKTESEQDQDVNQKDGSAGEYRPADCMLRLVVQGRQASQASDPGEDCYGNAVGCKSLIDQWCRGCRSVDQEECGEPQSQAE